jgi:hypothetical protein
MLKLKLLDYLLEVIHLLVIVFNLIGWIWPAIRRWHMLVVGLTLFSWLGLGIWYGWGYCFLTEWHWQVKRELGVRGLPPSYIEYLLEKLLPFDLSSELVNGGTLTVYAIAVLLSLYLNLRDIYRKK